MTAYDRAKGAYWGSELGRTLSEVDRAMNRLAAQPSEVEVEESIAGRAKVVVTMLRKATRAAEMLHFVLQRDDERPVKRLKRD